jgi:hypothetical protein
MERVSFLVESSGARLGCMLNPESVVVRRRAGVHARHSTAGRLAGAALKDDPLLYTGGGTTEVELDLLFDVTLAGSSVQTEDVRDLTQPLFELAEGIATPASPGEAPLVRFVWGKHWNIPGVVVAIAERLESFSPDGAPKRSWLRLRLRRVSDSARPAPPRRQPALDLAPPSGTVTPAANSMGSVRAHQLIGGGPEPPRQGTYASGERLDEIAYRYLGDPRQWRLVAAFNDIDNPLRVLPGRFLRIPLQT